MGKLNVPLCGLRELWLIVAGLAKSMTLGSSLSFLVSNFILHRLLCKKFTKNVYIPSHKFRGRIVNLPDHCNS